MPTVEDDAASRREGGGGGRRRRRPLPAKFPSKQLRTETIDSLERIDD